MLKQWIWRKAEALKLRIESGILSDKELKCRVVYGPVYSRRFGYVLGINNVSSNSCAYDCVYCPVKDSSCCRTEAVSCLSEYALYASVKKKLEELKNNNKEIKLILFTGSGDPAIDSNLPGEISILREFGYKIGVLTSSALFYNENVRENLLFADLVSIKLDSVNEESWLKINRPHPRLKYESILEGIEIFATDYKGTLITETMLLKGYNDSREDIETLGEYLNSLRRKNSYFTTPMYPPRKESAVSPEDSKLEMLKHIISEKIRDAVLLCCPAKEDFFSTDDFENELLGLLSVHPVNSDAVASFLRNKEDIAILNKLFKNGRIIKTRFRDKDYLVQNKLI